MLTGRQKRAGLGGGAVSLVGLALFVGCAVAALLGIGSNADPLAVFTDPVVLAVLRFTVWQALLSTLLSILLAIPVARALARRPRFAGRIWVLRLLALPMGLPVLIGALGLIGIWGRNGLINDLLAGLGAGRFSIYGLAGILVAHVFFNMPLAARLMLAGLERISPEYWLIAANLGMKPAGVFRFIEWPVLRGFLPGVASLIFMLCATSFTLVLVLGGGPAATTLEVAIYQALRFDFNPQRAVALALMQILVTIVILALMAAFPAGEGDGPQSGRRVLRLDGHGRVSRLGDGGAIAAALLFIGLPLLEVVAAGLRSDLWRLLTDWTVIRATMTSVAIAFCSGLLAVSASMAIILAQAAAAEVRRFVRVAGVFGAVLGALSSLVLLVPSMVLATGWFLLLRNLGEVGGFAPFVVAGINMMMALPFVMRVLKPAVDTHRRRTARLSASLGLAGFSAWRFVDWPVLRRPILMALSFAMALSLGDLGAVALFGAENLTTLPWLIYSRLGNYRSNDADGLALLLGLVCLGLTLFGATNSGRRRTDDDGT